MALGVIANRSSSATESAPVRASRSQQVRRRRGDRWRQQAFIAECGPRSPFGPPWPASPPPSGGNRWRGTGGRHPKEKYNACLRYSGCGAWLRRVPFLAAPGDHPRCAHSLVRRHVHRGVRRHLLPGAASRHAQARTADRPRHGPQPVLLGHRRCAAGRASVLGADLRSDRLLRSQSVADRIPVRARGRSAEVRWPAGHVLSRRPGGSGGRGHALLPHQAVAGAGGGRPDRRQPRPSGTPSGGSATSSTANCTGASPAIRSAWCFRTHPPTRRASRGCGRWPRMPACRLPTARR